jgi:protein-tyrosine phosphatase
LIEEELNLAEHVVALKRDEHFPIMVERFPGWAERIEYWEIHDIDQAHPGDALPQIEREVLALIRRLSQQTQGGA